jgi:hypothetical protein
MVNVDGLAKSGVTIDFAREIHVFPAAKGGAISG